MTPLTRIEVTGPGAELFLRWVVAGRADRPVGSVLYSVMLDERGGIRSDVSVARLGDDRFVIGGNGPRDAIGYVTSAGFGPSVGRSVAYAWVPEDLEAGAPVDLAYFERILPAVVTDEPLFDPDGARPRA